MITLTLDNHQLTLARPGATRIVAPHDAAALAQAIAQLAHRPAPTRPATSAQLGQRLAKARKRYVRETR
jgi:hypothetical protein